MLWHPRLRACLPWETNAKASRCQAFISGDESTRRMSLFGEQSVAASSIDMARLQLVSCLLAYQHRRELRKNLGTAGVAQIVSDGARHNHPSLCPTSKEANAANAGVKSVMSR
eukprot:300492-Pleurochrysis_carterae.AAC.4